MGRSAAGGLHLCPSAAQPAASAAPSLPTTAATRVGVRGERGGAEAVAEGARTPPRATPPSCCWVAESSRSPASFVRWALLLGRRRRPAPPRLRPAPPLHRARIRPPAQPQSPRAAATAGCGAGFRGHRGELSSALRACAVARPGLRAASVRRPGLADQLALRLRVEALRPPQGPAHQPLPGARLPVWTLLWMTPGRRLPWRGMVPTRW